MAPDTIKNLADDIYRERVLQARRMSPGEKFAAALEHSQRVIDWMKKSVRHQFPDKTEAEVHSIVAARLDRLRRVEEHGIYQPLDIGDDA